MRNSGFARGLWVSWLGFISILVVWQLVAAFQLINPVVFPGPARVAAAAIHDVPLGRLLGHIGVSLMRVILGFGIGASAGVLLGVACGWYLKLGSILRTPIDLVRPIPPLAWIPLAIIWLGLGEPSKVLIIFLGGFFPVFTNTYKGMVNVDPLVVRAAQMLGLRGRRLLLRVIVPATLPDIATGTRVGWSYSFGCMVAAELIAAKSGLGYLIMSARQDGQIAVIVYGVIVIGVINLVSDFLIHGVLIKRKLAWQSATMAQ
ncbi:MAG: ABC transporter permease [Spirochaetales bacterium]|nr:ABC transporter permease [Spirochaetales bacterium]